MINKKTVFYTLLLLLIILASLLLAIRYRNNSGITGKPVVVTFTSNKYEHDETLKYSKASVRVSYPLIESGLLSLSIKSFNEYIGTFAAGLFEEYRKWFNDMDGDPIDKESITTAESSIYGDYEIVRADENIISVRFRLIQNWKGMAHPYGFAKVINYSVKDNKNLSLSDLFKKDSVYLEILSNLVKQKIIDGYKTDGLWTDRFVDYLMGSINDGTKPEEESFRNFVIGDNYLLFIFDPYEVGSYADGTREARVMFKELDGYLNEEYL